MRDLGRRTIASVAAVGLVIASCTHVPTGEKAFTTYGECMAANVGLGAVIGIGTGVLIKKLTGSTAAAVATGVAASMGVGLVAWKRCAAVYSTTTTTAQQSRDDLIASGRVVAKPAPALTVDEFGARVDRDAAVVHFDLGLTFIADSTEEKDVPMTIRHRLGIAKMKESGDTLILVDDADQPLRGANGQPIPTTAFATADGRIVYQDFYDKTDKEIIQQGSRKLVHELPTAIQGLRYPMPMRYTVTVNVGRFVSETTLDFYLPDARERPKTFAAKTPPATQAPAPQPSTAQAATPRGTAPPATTPPKAETAAKPADKPVVRYVTQRAVTFYQAAGGGPQAGRFPANTLLQAGESKTIVSADGKPALWLKVSSAQGITGWIRRTDVVEVK